MKTAGKLQEVDLFLPRAPRRSARINPRLQTTKLLALRTIRKTPKKPPQWMEIAARIRAGISAQARCRGSNDDVPEVCSAGH